jgi:hypothetical protein
VHRPILDGCAVECKPRAPNKPRFVSPAKGIAPGRSSSFAIDSERVVRTFFPQPQRRCTANELHRFRQRFL